MYFKKIFFSISLFFGVHAIAVAQSSVTVTPENTTIYDTLTITYNASLGNKALMNFSNTVYMHSGLITGTSATQSDWKYAIGNWGTDDKPSMMKKVGENLYQKNIVLKDYYGVPANEEIKFMTFVFRDVTGTKVGKDEQNKDIFVAVKVKAVVDKKVFLKNYVSHQFINNTLIVKSDTACVVVKPYTDNCIKVSFFMDGKIVADTSYSVILQASNSQVKLNEQPDFIELQTASFKIHINKIPLRISYSKVGAANDAATFFSDENGFFTESNSKGFRFKLKENEAIYGTGSRATSFNKRGQKFASYNTASYGYKIGAPTLNVNIPFIVSTELYGIYFENFSAGNFDIGATEKNILEYKVEQGNLSYYIIDGNNFAEIMNSYTELTGKQPLPPRWSLGFIQSKYGYKSDKETLKIVKKLQKEKFPIDGVVLDLYWFGSPKTMGNLDWDRSKFKHPEKLITDLDSLGVKLIPITETFIAKTSTNFDYLDKNKLLAKNKEGNSYVIENFWAGPSGLLDIYQPEAKEWMWKKYKKQIDAGVGGWWCDLGEPESHPEGMIHSLGSARYVHNVYSQFWAQMLSDKYKQEYPNQRLFNLIRSGYAGMQRYSAFPWSGDIQRSYDGLKTQVQIMLSMGMSGVAYTHSDLGGFTGGPKNPELYTRWLQYGAFCPIMRAHGEGVPAEPIFYDSKYKNIVRDYINLRYKLLPYSYTLSYENTTIGIPIARSINFYEPENTSISNVCDEYFWGDNFLVAPVFEANATSRNVIFPKGKWINYWTNEMYNGNSTAKVDAPLERMPLFVKAGSFIPTTSLCTSTKYYKTDSLWVYYYPDASVTKSEFSMYDDDGKTAAANEKGSFEMLKFSGDVTSTSTIINTTKLGNGYANAPKQRVITYVIKLQIKAPQSVNINETIIPKSATDNDFRKQSQASYYNAMEKILYVRFVLNSSESKIKIDY